MNRKTAIVTDTNSGITVQEASRLEITLIQMPVMIDQISYNESSITPDFFFEAQGREDSKIITSQPSAGELIRIFSELAETFEDIVYIPMSSALSSACQTAKMLCSEYRLPVYTADNRRISVTQKQSVLDALRMAEAGMHAQEICSMLEAHADDNGIYIMVDSLHTLSRTGRITPAASALGSLLKVHPILKIMGGKIDAFSICRSVRKAKHILLETLKNDLEQLEDHVHIILHTAWSGMDEEFTAEWEKEVSEAFPEYPIASDPLPFSICAHTGPGCFGIGWSRQWHPDSNA